jgi:hypothetical protein
MKYIFLIIALIISIPSFSFDYNQKMIEYKGGIISQLNNCGVNYSSSGIFTRGYSNLTAGLSKPENTVIDFKKFGNGLISILDDGRLLLDEAGKSLDGSQSITLKKIDLTIRSRYPVDDASVLGLSVQDNYVAVLTSNKLHLFLVDHGQIVSEYSSNFSYQYQVIGGWRPVYGDAVVRYAEVINNQFYLQYSNGDVKKANSIRDLMSTKTLVMYKKSVPTIRQIIPYKFGVATLFKDSKIIYSSNPSDILEGEVIYGGAKPVSSILNYAGDAVAYGTSSLLVAFIDGRVIYSPDGLNLEGGGNSREITSPINTSELTEQLKYQLKNYETDRLGAYVTEVKTSVRLLNKGSSTEYDGTWFIGMDGINRIFVKAVSFSGIPVTMEVYDKGWDGIEYKWRDRGSQVGTILHTHTNSKVGETEIKLKAKDSCAVLIGVSQAGETPNPISFNVSIEPKSFYSMVKPSGLAPVSGRKFALNALGFTKDLLFGDIGWNLWTFYPDAGSFSALLGYLEYKNNFDISRTLMYYGKKELDRLPGLQRGTDEIFFKESKLIRQRTSLFCVHPSGGNEFPSVGTPLVLHPTCDPYDERLLFNLLPNGVLQHESSGLCVQPETGVAQQGQRLVLSDLCYKRDPKDKSIVFDFDKGSFRHTASGLCVHPAGGSSTPSAGTQLVLWSGCDDERLKYNRY